MEPEEVTHYVCTGSCGGVSPNPGICQMPECGKSGQPLTACGCDDGSHSDTTLDDTTQDAKEDVSSTG